MKSIPLSAALTSALLLWCALPQMAAADATRPFLHPDRIRYDSQCLTIDGQDTFLYSGAFHYFRCPHELWRDRFQKIKEAGFNCVETYVAWNWCERQMPAGLDDYSKVDMSGLDEFLTTAEEFGLYVIVRPGPYICAEWDTGGYPQWLLTKQPAGPMPNGQWLRSDDPVYLAWCRHWYHAVCPVIARHQLTRKAAGQPGVILVQLENEYDYAGLPDNVMLNQVRALGEQARADGIDVPFITCWTHPVRGNTDPLLRQVFDCCNFYPRWDVDGIQGDIKKLRNEQPDAPLATTELQGGWFSNVGGKLSEDQEGVNAAQINNLTLLAIQNGESILNYYMLFGGTNPDDWGARGLTTTYDYNAPIREWGGVGDRYARVWAIAHMLREHGVRLARSQVVDCSVAGTQKDVSVVLRRAPDGSRYLFVRTSQHTEPRQGTAHIKQINSNAPELVFDYDLEPFGSKILYLPPGENDPARGQWLPQPAPTIERPADLPPPITLTTALTRTDSGAKDWNKIKPGASLAQDGIYDSHFLFYRAKIKNATATNLLVNRPAGDAVLALINGQPAAPVSEAKNQSVFALPPGRNDVRLLYENHAHANGGADMAAPCGITAARLTSVNLNGAGPIGGWHMHLVDGTSNRLEVAADFDDSAWSTVAVDRENANQLKPGQIAVFRAPLELAAADFADQLKLRLNFGRIDDFGWVYINGHSAGTTTDWSHPWSFDATPLLHPGHNLIAVVVQNKDGDGGLGQPDLEKVSKGSQVRLTLSRPAGDAAQWWQPELPASDWQLVNLGANTPAAQNPSVLTWYRMNFALPTPPAKVWIPWRLHILAQGNGFLYLNGHPLGRYWNEGPQHDFFLPECWLKFGGGQTNTLTLNLRPIDGRSAIQSAIVEPYQQFAEKR